MRVAFTSDIHADNSESARRVPRLLGDRLRALSPDVFVLLGDLAGHLEVLEESFAEIGELPFPKLFVAGNHDVWVPLNWQSRGETSYDRLDRLLPEICARHGWGYLDGGPLRVGDVGFVGGVGWYDYSLRNRARDGEISMDVYRRKFFRRWRWGDAVYALFTDGEGERLSDEEVCRLLEGRLSKHLAEVARWDVRAVVGCSHHMPYDVIRPPGRLPWDFFLAYAGSARFGRLFDTELRLAAVLFGHVHLKFSRETPAGRPLVTSCLGYARHWSDPDPEKALDAALRIIEI
ncbi:MAG: metallophosphoesterase [bacterium]|nr:metallophosphoesterase [bacterium]